KVAGAVAGGALLSTDLRLRRAPAAAPRHRRGHCLVERHRAASFPLSVSLFFGDDRHSADPVRFLRGIPFPGGPSNGTGMALRRRGELSGTGLPLEVLRGFSGRPLRCLSAPGGAPPWQAA